MKTFVDLKKVVRTWARPPEGASIPGHHIVECVIPFQCAILERRDPDPPFEDIHLTVETERNGILLIELVPHSESEFKFPGWRILQFDGYQWVDMGTKYPV